ncbi:uncharacterized protein SPSC_03365 [Sporisorium scitamineum]|uniref:Flavin reductase like domain-containing protein n=1 Tax=Sporisorium scitamineum TaxID=49012 RepID=A0A0F7SCT4_9BASI|nr:uncharacterized protein SPSC_03365 [Sporisorium scitamineum]CDW99489.1 hypothetical protein [Sporisorium scitamineum]
MSLLLPASTAARATTSKVTLEAFLPLTRRTSSYQRRPFSRSSPPRSPQDDNDTSTKIRTLMRKSAQPVALVTTFLPSSPGKTNHIHAATLSSFTSISLDPDLVCFSIKTPSKLADALSSHVSSRGVQAVEEEEGWDFVINVLSAKQAGLAAAYAVPGTPPLVYPSTEGGAEEGHPLRQAGLVGGGGGEVPLVRGSIGALACQVVDSVELDRYSSGQVTTEGDTQRSRLYIARVLEVHFAEKGNKNDLKPLIYHRQKFVSTTNHPLI